MMMQNNCVFKQCFEYKSPYMLENDHPNMVMIALQNLIEMSLYKDLNVTIHHQWASLFSLLLDLDSQILKSSDASFENSNSNNEKLHCTPKDLMIHNLLEVPKLIDYENIIYSIAPSQHFHPLGLFKDKNSKELNFPTLFYGQIQ
jgi:hypothetical protein